MEPGAFVWIDCLSCAVGSIFSLATESTINHRTVFLPTANSDLTLFRSNTASKGQNLDGFEGSDQYSCQRLRNYFLSSLEFLTVANHVLGIFFPTGEDLKGSKACASRRGNNVFLSSGGAAGRGGREK